MKDNFRFHFHIFDDPVPQQQLTLNPNWTGQAPGVGTYTNKQDLSPEMKTFFDKMLIRLAKPKLVHDQFAQMRPIPAGNGKTIEFRKFGSLPKATTPLTEGITPTGQSVGTYAITATIAQYGAYIATTDMLNLTAYDNTNQEFLTLLADQAGLTSDTITRDVMVGGTNVMFADAGNDGNDERSDLGADDVLTVLDIKKAVRLLKRNNAPKIGNSYVAIIHPDASFDIQNDPEWIEAAKYGKPEQLFEGEIGKIAGVRFVETTEAKIWKDNTCPVVPGSGADTVYRPVYRTMILGARAYGVTKINGNGIQTFVKQLGSGGTSDPLNQRATMGWKLAKVAKRLVEEYMVGIEHTASIGVDVDAN